MTGIGDEVGDFLFGIGEARRIKQLVDVQRNQGPEATGGVVGLLPEETLRTMLVIAVVLIAEDADIDSEELDL